MSSMIQGSKLFIIHDRLGVVVPMEKVSVAIDGDSQAAMDGAKSPSEWEPHDLVKHIPC